MIEYRVNQPLNAAQFAQILHDSTLAARRPVDDRARLQRMLDNADVTISAWDGELLVGLARTITDWSYCAYLSDLAVHKDYQHQGIGRELIARTQHEIGPQAMLLLLTAPAAAEYYAKVGFEKVENGWIIRRER